MSNTNIVYPEHFHGCMSMNKSWAPCQTGGSLGCRAWLHDHCHSGLCQLGCFVKLASMGILALAYVALGALGQDLSQGKFYRGVHGLGSFWLWFLLRIFIQGCAFVQLPFMALARGDCFQFILLGPVPPPFSHSLGSGCFHYLARLVVGIPCPLGIFWLCHLVFVMGRFWSFQDLGLGWQIECSMTFAFPLSTNI